jgi:hypothetical protein
MQQTAFHKYKQNLPTAEAQRILESKVAELASQFGAAKPATPAPRTGGASEAPKVEGTREPNTLSSDMTAQRSLAPMPSGEDWDDDFDPVVEDEKKLHAAIEAALHPKR